ncbi:MAG: hypothetical protein D4R67_12025 [Bacteroidetes bacterium]|nr:MAG: hypothetical protein D4R67_12025 [Bacteroidota bacterium]
MKNEFNYTFYDTSRKLHDLGIRWKPNKWWRVIHVNSRSRKYLLVDKLLPYQQGVPAYSLSELGMIIPFGFFNEIPVVKFLGGYFKLKIEGQKELTFSTEVEARAHYLIYLIESGQAQVEPIETEKTKTH